MKNYKKLLIKYDKINMRINAISAFLTKYVMLRNIFCFLIRDCDMHIEKICKFIIFLLSYMYI